MKRLTYILSCCAIGALATYFGAQYVHGNEQVVPLLVTVFTVFAGFMVAVIVILGDPLLLPSGSWRTAEKAREGIEGRLIRHMYLFLFYLLTIAVIFVSVLIKDVPADIISNESKIWIERAYVWLSVTALCLSFAMPLMLIETQKTRVEEEMKRRRAAEGIKEET